MLLELLDDLLERIRRELPVLLHAGRLLRLVEEVDVFHVRHLPSPSCLRSGETRPIAARESLLTDSRYIAASRSGNTTRNRNGTPSAKPARVAPGVTPRSTRSGVAAAESGKQRSRRGKQHQPHEDRAPGVRDEGDVLRGVLDADEEQRGADRAQHRRRDLAAADASHGHPRAATVERVDELARRLFAEGSRVRKHLIMWHGSLLVW